MQRRGKENSGGDLLSHTVSRAVPSALEGLTSEFGMGSGVTPPALPPETGKDAITQPLRLRAHGCLSASAFIEKRLRTPVRALLLPQGHQTGPAGSFRQPWPPSPIVIYSLMKINDGQASRPISTS